MDQSIYRKHADWLQRMSQVKPLLEKRNKIYLKRFSLWTREKQRKFSSGYVCIVKQYELQDSLRISDSKRMQRSREFGEKVVWRCTCRREIQHTRRGLVLVRTATIKDEEDHAPVYNCL